MPNSTSAPIQINGEEQTFTLPLTISDLLSELHLKNKRIAVELNREIIPKSEHATTIIQANDSIEIVNAIGGG